MKLNSSKLFFLIIYLLFIHIISTPDNNTNELYEKEDEETLAYRKEISEYYKIFYSDIKPIILTDENYTKYIQSNPYTLIYLHSPEDIHSKNFIPSFKAIHNYLNTESNSTTFLPIRLAAIDLMDNDHNYELESLFRLNNFPFFIIYSSIYGSYIEYTGYMTPQSIITFCTKATLGNIITMNQENKIKNILNPELTYMTLISLSNNFNFDDYYRASQEFKFAIFADCIGQKKCLNYLKNLESNNLNLDNTDIILVKMNSCNNDFLCDNDINNNKVPQFIPYKYKSYDDFIEFISMNIIPPVCNLTDFNYEIIKKNNFFKTMIYIKGENEQKNNKEISKILDNIIKNKKNLGINLGSILDPLNSANDYETTKLFSIEPDDYKNNSLVIIYSPDKILSKEYNVYRLNNSDINSGEINEEIIIDFINKYNSGFIKKDIKSELIPKYHPKKNLRMVVGKTFNQEILNNFKKTNVLILLTLDMKNLHIIEDQIESLTIKFSKYNDSIIFNFLDPALNEMPNMPKYNILEKPFYRYYYKNKKIKYIDFKGNSTDQAEIEDWIIDNYGKEYGIEHKYGMRMHIEGMTELLKDKKIFKEIEEKQKFEQYQEDMGIKFDSQIEKNKTEDSSINNKEETDL